MVTGVFVKSDGGMRRRRRGENINVRNEGGGQRNTEKYKNLPGGRAEKCKE